MSVDCVLKWILVDMSWEKNGTVYVRFEFKFSNFGLFLDQGDGMKSAMVQLNKCETDPYFLQNF